MILYYAAGGGMGHLTRMRALVHTLGIDEPVTVLAPPRHGADHRITGEARVIPLTDDLARDPFYYRGWLASTIESIAPSRIIVDTFPGGILGELCGLEIARDIPRDIVARSLRWERYSPLLRDDAPRFATGYSVEPLPREQHGYLLERCDTMRSIELVDPPSAIDAEAIIRSAGLEPKPLWLVVHSGSDEEILELAGYAIDSAYADRADPAILLIAPRRPAGLGAAIRQIDIYPALPFFPHADRIFTACGFNAMRQTLPWRELHRFIPFDRRYDDQFARAQRRMKFEGRR